MLFSIVYTSLHSHQQASSFCTSLSTLVACCHFDGSHSDRREVVSPCGFGFHFPDN